MFTLAFNELNAPPFLKSYRPPWLNIFFSFFQKFQYGYVFILKPAQLWTIILNGIFFVCQNWSALRVCWADCFEKSWKTLWGGKYHLNLINEVLGTYPSIWVLEVFSMEEWVKLNKNFFFILCLLFTLKTFKLYF